MMASSGEAALFWVLAPLMVLAALGLVLARKAVYAALSMIFVMVALAVLYVAQEAPFLGVVQIVVYVVWHRRRRRRATSPSSSPTPCAGCSDWTCSTS